MFASESTERNEIHVHLADFIWALRSLVCELQCLDKSCLLRVIIIFFSGANNNNLAYKSNKIIHELSRHITLRAMRNVYRGIHNMLYLLYFCIFRNQTSGTYRGMLPE